jgi:hypothetical protein
VSKWNPNRIVSDPSCLGAAGCLLVGREGERKKSDLAGRHTCQHNTTHLHRGMKKKKKNWEKGGENIHGRNVINRMSNTVVAFTFALMFSSVKVTRPSISRILQAGDSSIDARGVLLQEEEGERKRKRTRMRETPWDEKEKRLIGIECTKKKKKNPTDTHPLSYTTKSRHKVHHTHTDTDTDTYSNSP